MGYHFDRIALRIPEIGEQPAHTTDAYFVASWMGQHRLPPAARIQLVACDSVAHRAPHNRFARVRKRLNTSLTWFA
jgi:hypothetical protein